MTCEVSALQPCSDATSNVCFDTRIVLENQQGQVESRRVVLELCNGKAA